MLVKGQPARNEARADVDPIYSVMDDEGRLRPGAHVPEVEDAAALKLYRGMLQVRLVDERMMKLQRQGRLGFYMQSIGEEATHFGGAYRAARRATGSSRRTASRARRSGAATRCSDFTNQLFGNAEDPVKGRQMPVHHSARWINFVSITLAGRHADPAGGRHGVGGEASPRRTTSRSSTSARARPRRASSTSGMNFAGVFKAPVHLLLPQQRLGDLDARATSRPRRKIVRRQGASPTACPASASTATTCSP